MTVTIGTLYSSTGQFAASSLPELDGLRFWVNRVNGQGGVEVAALGHRVRIRLVALDDRSSAALAARLYDRLVTTYRVTVLVADFGSVLTAPAIPIAERNQVLLFDQTGSGSSFFLGDNPYLVLCDLPTSSVWPDPLVRFILAQHLRRVALVYGQNEFDGAQDTAIAGQLTLAGQSPVANISVPTATGSYAGILPLFRKVHAQAVIELGYQNNDLAFLPEIAAFRRVRRWQGLRMVFTAFPGQLPGLFGRQVSAADLAGTFTYGFPPVVAHGSVNAGLSLHRFVRAFLASDRRPANFLNVAGYNTGLVIQAALEHASSFSELGLRAALNGLSGRIKTLDGTFRVNGAGAQLGDAPPVAEIVPTGSGSLGLKVVFPRAGMSAGPTRSG
ncbi:MAG: ABC transporter substrate-binding protein [Streptosporangiaceae bacterium]